MTTSYEAIKALIERGQLPMAIVRLSESSELSEADQHYLFGLIEAKRGDFTAAETRCRQALHANPTHHAQEMLYMLSEIKAFHHKDNLNP